MIPLLAQVAATLALIPGTPTATLVGNPTDHALRVEIALHTGDIDSATGDLTLGDPVANALITPASFTLAPGRTQVIRLLLRERRKPGTILRLVTTFTPLEASTPVPTGGGDATTIARVAIVTRLVSKVTVR